MRGELLLTVGRLRVAWSLLSMVSTLDRAGRRPARPELDQAAREQLDYLVVRERRAARIALRERRVPSTPKPAPVPAGVLDARTAIDLAVTEAAAQAYRVTTGEALRVPWATNPDARVTESLGVLGRAARSGLPGGLLLALVEQLDPVATLADQAAGLAPVWVPVPGTACPACELSTLRVRQDSPDTGEWVAECRDRTCVCRGPACRCGVVERLPGRRHVWARDEWSTLTALNA